MDFLSFRREKKKSIFFPFHRGVCGPPSACSLLGSQSRQIVESFLLPQDLPSLLPRILLPILLLILYLNICILFYFSSSLPFFLSWKTFTQILIRRWGREDQPVTWGSVTPSRQEWTASEPAEEEASHTLLRLVRGHRAWPVTFLSQARSHWALRAHFTSGQPVGWVKELPFNQPEADPSVLHSEGAHRTPAAGASLSGLFWWLFKKTFLLECSWFTMLCSFRCTTKWICYTHTHTHTHIYIHSF